MHIYIRKRYLEKTNMSSSLVKLVKYYPNYKTSFGWYQDLELCKQVDNIDTVYDLNRLKRMYKYLNKNGKLYYIKYKGRLVGDICLENNGYVAIVVSKPYQNMHIGSVAINEIKKIAKDNNMQEIKATIYSFNKQSQKMFLNNGFEKVTEENYIYKIRMI